MTQTDYEAKKVIRQPMDDASVETTELSLNSYKHLLEINRERIKQLEIDLAIERACKSEKESENIFNAVVLSLSMLFTDLKEEISKREKRNTGNDFDFDIRETNLEKHAQESLSKFCNGKERKCIPPTRYDDDLVIQRTIYGFSFYKDNFNYFFNQLSSIMELLDKNEDKNVEEK